MAQSADYERPSIAISLSTPAPLSHIETLAARALFGGDTHLAAEEVEALARRLAGVNGASSRHQLLSVQLATAHVHALALESILGSLIKKSDEPGALLISRLLTDATRRVAILAAAHAGRPRPVLMVGHADRVSVSAGEAL